MRNIWRRSGRRRIAPLSFVAIQIAFSERTKSRKGNMKLNDKTSITGAMGYILLWLIGIPIPILLLIFLLRGCT